MNKKKRLHILIFLITLSCMLIVSCPNPFILQILDPKTVNFETNGGSGVKSQTVYKDFPVIRPSDPVRGGYIFDAWYADDETFVNKWNFDTAPNADITLYANWTTPCEHEWGEWGITSAPTETANGTETRVCLLDSSHKETRTAYATGTAGLDFTLIGINGGTNNAYRVSNKDTSNDTATGNIVIPAYHRPDADSPYLPVTEISSGTNSSANNAFGGTSPYNLNTTVTSITFAAGSRLTTISNFAFLYCANLKSITIPASVTTIGPDAFDYCDNLTTVTIPANSNLTLIGDSAFLYCASLTGITIPASVTSIGLQAFGHCTSLASITIPSSVTAIGQGTFVGCTSLASVTIGAGVATIGNSAFSGCTNIKSVTFAAGSQLKTISHAAFLGCTSLTGITIPAGVTEIDDWAFSGCTSLTGIIIPASVTSIGATAFADCTSLASVTIGAGVATIGDNAFQNCTSLRNITIDTDKVTSYGGNSFFQGSNWATIFPADDLSVTFRKNVGNYAFMGCLSLTSVTIAAGVTSIGDQAFEGCGGLTSVTIAAGVTTIGNMAFVFCNSLTSITIPATVTSIGNQAFDCTSLTRVTFAGTIASSSSFDNNAFGFGDLPAKHLAGGPGTYTRTGGSGAGGDPYVWMKQ